MFRHFQTQTMWQVNKWRYIRFIYITLVYDNIILNPDVLVFWVQEYLYLGYNFNINNIMMLINILNDTNGHLQIYCLFINVYDTHTVGTSDFKAILIWKIPK